MSTWRTNVTLVADDGWTPDTDDRDRHTRQAERLATDFIPDYMTKEKIFLSKYETVITGFRIDYHFVKASNSLIFRSFPR